MRSLFSLIGRSFYSRIMLPLSLTLLVIGISVYVVARVKGRAMVKNNSVSILQSPRNAYTLVQQRIATTPDNKEVIQGVITRHLASDGNFVEESEVGRKKSIAFSHKGRYLRLNKRASGDELIDEGPYDANAGFTEENLQRSPNLKKDHPVEWVAGVKCYVVHFEFGDTSIDHYFAPSLGGFPIQTIHKLKSANFTTIIKPVTLVFGEPDRKVFENLPVTLPRKALRKN